MQDQQKQVIQCKTKYRLCHIGNKTLNYNVIYPIDEIHALANSGEKLHKIEQASLTGISTLIFYFSFGKKD